MTNINVKTYTGIDRRSIPTETMDRFDRFMTYIDVDGNQNTKPIPQDSCIGPVSQFHDHIESSMFEDSEVLWKIVEACNQKLKWKSKQFDEQKKLQQEEDNNTVKIEVSSEISIHVGAYLSQLAEICGLTEVMHEIDNQALGNDLFYCLMGPMIDKVLAANETLKLIISTDKDQLPLKGKELIKQAIIAQNSFASECVHIKESMGESDICVKECADKLESLNSKVYDQIHELSELIGVTDEDVSVAYRALNKRLIEKEGVLIGGSCE